MVQLVDRVPARLGVTPVAASRPVSRPLVAVSAGWALTRSVDGGLVGRSVAVAAAFAVYCGITVGAFKAGARRSARLERIEGGQ